MRAAPLLEVLRRVAEDPTRLATILAEVADPLIAFDSQRLIIGANEAAEGYCRYERGELIAKSADALLPPRFRQENAPPPAVTFDVTNVELPVLRRDGTEVMTVWSFAAVEAPRGPVFVMSLREHAQVLRDLETTTYAAVFESTPVPLALAREADNSIVAMNQAFADLFELQREAFIGRAGSEMEIASPEQREEIARMLAESGVVRALECDRRTVTGKPLHVSLSVTRVRIGGVDHILSTVQDLSMRKAQEVALAHARGAAEHERQKLRSILMQAPVPICILEGPDHTFTFANPRFVELVGGRDIVGKPLLEALPDVRGDGFDELLDRVRATGEPFSAREVSVQLSHHAPDERLTVDFVCQPMRDESGRVNAMVAVVTDVSALATMNAELKKTATALAESRGRSDYAVRLSGIGFWYCDLPFDQLDWDARVKEHFFLPPEARVTIDVFYDRIVADDREPTRAAIEASIRDRALYDVIYRTQHPTNGAVKWIRAMGGTSYAPDGAPIRFDGVTVDITIQKRDEAQLAAAAAQLEEANRVKDDFLAMFSHELRNPLAPIITAVQLLKLRGVEAREITIIERQAQHLRRLVDDLLDVSRVRRGKVNLERVPIELGEVVATAIEMASPLLEQRRHHLEVDVPAAGLVIDGDAVRLAQVVSNLLTNAAKYTEPGGRVRLAAAKKGPRVSLSVVDTGIGIAPEMLGRVFEPFAQAGQALDRAQGGLGLGLAVVAHLVELHGGTVAAHSAGRGSGSTFTVDLPLSTKPAVAARAEALPETRRRQPDALRVLIVDDNEDAADLLCEVLSLLGCETRVAHDGAEAIRVADEYEPQVALLDIGLPAMDGYELAGRLRNAPRGEELRLVAVTGYAQDSDRQRATEAGFDAHLVKPVELEAVTGLIDAYRAGFTLR